MRYRYKPDMVEVEVTCAPHPNGGSTWTVIDRLSGTVQVLTDEQFHEHFEPAIDPADRLCTACKHLGKGPRKRPYAWCASPRVTIDPVDGERQFGTSCRKARSRGGVCGPFGRCWEPPDVEPAQ